MANSRVPLPNTREFAGINSISGVVVGIDTVQLSELEAGGIVPLDAAGVKVESEILFPFADLFWFEEVGASKRSVGMTSHRVEVSDLPLGWDGVRTLSGLEQQLAD